MRRDASIMDRINDTPVTYCVLVIYFLMAHLTGIYGPFTERQFELLIEYGAAAGILVQDGEAWRLLSNAFLHGGLIHLLLNAYGLYVLGPSLEHYLRPWRFIVLYAVSAVVGSLFALTVNQEHVQLVGGSGALFGMLGGRKKYVSV